MIFVRVPPRQAQSARIPPKSSRGSLGKQTVYLGNLTFDNGNLATKPQLPLRQRHLIESRGIQKRTLFYRREVCRFIIMAPLFRLPIFIDARHCPKRAEGHAHVVYRTH